MDNPNPIYYRDLIQPDESIKQLIDQLSEVIGQYEKLRTEVQKGAQDAAKAMQGLSGATDEQRQAIAQNAQRAEEMAQKYRKLTDEEAQLKAAQQEVIAANREAVKMARLQKEAAEAAEGSYKKLSAQYRINKEQLNAMSKAEREGTAEGRKLETETRKIYEEMSRLQKATGKYTLEVGHYENALKGLPGILGQFGRGLEGARQQATTMKESVATLAEGMGMKTGGLLAVLGGVAVAVGGAVAAFKLWKDSIHETQATGDALDYSVAQWNGAWEVFQKSVSTFNFTNFISGAIESAKAAGNLRLVMDEAFERENSIRLQKTALAEENEMYLEALRNQKLSNTERIEAGRAYLAAMQPIYDQEKALAKDSADAQLEYLFAVTNRTKYATAEQREAAKQEFALFIERYNVNREGIKQAQELIKAEDELREIQTGRATQYSTDLKYWNNVRKSLQETVDAADADTQALARMLRQYKFTKDEEVRNYVDATERYRNASAAMARENRRIYTQINSLESQLLKDSKKATAEREALLERDKAASAAAAESVSKDIAVRGEALTQSVAMEESAAAAITKAQEQLNAETRKAGIKRLSGIKENYDAIKALYSTKEKEAADEAVRAMLDAGTEAAAIASAAAESGDEDVWKAVGAKSKEEAIQMAEQAKQEATDIVIAANKAMKETGAGLEWKFYSPAEGWSLIAPEPSGDTGGATGGDAGGGTTNTKKGGAWSLQGQKKYQEERLKLLRQLEAGELASRQEYEDALAALEMRMLEERLAKLRKGSTEAIKIEGELIERREKAAQSADAAAKKADDDAVKAGFAYLNHQKEVLQMEIAGAEQGTSEMLALRLELIEKEREIELKLNREKAEEMRMDEALINAKYDRLRLNEVGKIAKETVKRAQKSTRNESRPKEAQDLFDVFGIQLGEEGEAEDVLEQRKRMLLEAVGEVKEAVSSLVDSWREQAHAAVEAADTQVESAQKIVDAEIEAQAQGYAANVARAQAELQQAKKNREEALKEEQKAQAAQMALDTATQASSLVTASANIWKSLSGVPLVGPALAVAALALMWGSFAASKIKAAQVAKETYGEGTVELLKGGSHASGNDIFLGTTEDGKERRAEGGEYFAVINKRNSRKYGALIPDVINSFNDGTFAEKYMRSGEAMKGYAIQMMAGADLTKVEAGIDAIRKQGEESRTTEGGYTVVRYKNLTRRIKS